MKQESHYRSLRRRAGLAIVAWLVTVSTIFASQLSAGLINVNFMDSGSGLNPDGPGVLGAGIWNRILDTNAGLTNNLFDSTSGTTTASLSLSNGAVSGVSQINGNPVQNDSWSNAGGAVVTITGVLPGQVYKVAIYSDRIGSGNLADTYVVNGLGRSLPNAGPPGTGLPGVANVDYAIFEITSSSAGLIVLTLPAGGSVAGMQIQGVLGGEDGPRMDCLITKSPSSTGGKGDGVYKVPTNKKQTLTKKVKGSKAVKTYVNVQNDGLEIDNCYLMGFWKNRHFKRVRIKDRATGANVTAAALALNYRFILDAGETRSFFVKAKRAKQRSGNTSLQVCASPSTLVASQQDCVTSTIK